MTKTVIVLGSGMSAPQIFQYLDKHDIKVIVASRTLETAQKNTKGLKHAEAVKVDIEKKEDVEKLEEMIPKADALVSMLPYIHHPTVAKLAIKHKKHFFTTSYVTDVMRSMDEDAKKAGIIMINECGVDPGTDHMSAMRVIDSVRSKNGKITSFTSFCGGLPAPDANDNPFGYKLSWAPRGVLLASRNPAHFLKDGKDVNIEGKDLFDNYTTLEVPDIGKLEAYPNRNSTQYIDIYGIKDVKTMIRGTYRFSGWCPTIKKLADLGLLEMDEKNLQGKTYADMIAEIVHSNVQDVKQKTAEFLKIEKDSLPISNMEWLGLFSNEQIPSGRTTYLDAVCHLFEKKLVYKPGERDMIFMRHEFTAEFSDRTEYLSSSLVSFGVPNGPTAMSRTVGIPVAIAIRLVLEGKIKLTGLHIPIIPELYNPILDELEKEDIKFVEKVEKVEKK